MMRYDKNSQSAENIKKAFGDEAAGHARYMLFGEEARRNGEEQLANVYDRLASEELAHAEMWLREMGGVGSTEENLNASIAEEKHDWMMHYMPYASTADHEGYEELTERFLNTANVEKRHEAELKEILGSRRNGSFYRDSEAVEWRCGNCGYVGISENAPAVCPLCGYPRGYFRRG